MSSLQMTKKSFNWQKKCFIRRKLYRHVRRQSPLYALRGIWSAHISAFFPTCALATFILRLLWHFVCAHLSGPLDPLPGRIFMDTHISLDTHLPGHGDRFGGMASINSLSSTKCRIFVDEASKKDLPSTKWAWFVDGYFFRLMIYGNWTIAGVKVYDASPEL